MMMLRSAFFWDIMQFRVVTVYRHYETTYLSHLQGPIVQARKKASNTNVDSRGVGVQGRYSVSVMTANRV
jgi:hypothetical protein